MLTQRSPCNNTFVFAPLPAVLTFIKLAAQGSCSASNSQRFCLAHTPGGGRRLLTCVLVSPPRHLSTTQPPASLSSGLKEAVLQVQRKERANEWEQLEKGAELLPFFQVDDFGDALQGTTRISPTCHEVGCCHWCTPDQSEWSPACRVSKWTGWRGFVWKALT